MSTEARTNTAVLALEGDEKLMRGDLAGANDLYTKMAASMGLARSTKAKAGERA